MSAKRFVPGDLSSQKPSLLNTSLYGSFNTSFYFKIWIGFIDSSHSYVISVKVYEFLNILKRFSDVLFSYLKRKIGKRIFQDLLREVVLHPPLVPFPSVVVVPPSSGMCLSCPSRFGSSTESRCPEVGSVGSVLVSCPMRTSPVGPSLLSTLTLLLDVASKVLSPPRGTPSTTISSLVSSSSWVFPLHSCHMGDRDTPWVRHPYLK